jgi:hypothetical protein
MDRVELRRARQEVEALQEQVKRLRASHDNLYRLAKLIEKSQTRWLMLFRLATLSRIYPTSLRADLEAQWPDVFCNCQAGLGRAG